MQAQDVMTRKVVTVTAETPIAEAARLMVDNRISGLPVTDAAGAVVGIVSEGDLLRRSETGTGRHRPGWYEWVFGPSRLAEDYTRSHARKVGEVMTAEPVCAAPETPLDEVVGLMEKHGIKRVPVIADGRLVGIVSRANLVAVLAGMLARPPDAPLGDAEIGRRLRAEIDRQRWGPGAAVAIEVAGGIVELSGTIRDERERTALIVAAETLPGVKAVEDHLVWIEPNSGMVVPPPERD